MSSKYQSKITAPLLIASLMALLSCAALKKTRSHRILCTPKDSVADMKRILQLRSLDNGLFDSGSYSGNGFGAVKYRLLKPAKIGTAKSDKVPLVILFHGSGAIGHDNKRQLGALAKLWADKEIQSKFNAYVVVPQFDKRSSNYHFDSARGQMASLPAPCLQSALQLIDSLKKVYNIDESRIYAVGYSMGGSTVVNALSLHPDLFAAGVSISGVPQFDSVHILSRKPLLLIHGNKDTENPFSSDSLFYQEIKKGHKVEFLELNDRAHEDIFSEEVLGDLIPAWLFSKTKH